MTCKHGPYGGIAHAEPKPYIVGKKKPGPDPSVMSQERLEEIKKAAMETEPTAQWVWDDNALDWGLGAWVCSKCHTKNQNIHSKKDEDPNIWEGTNFCPQCGAQIKK